MTYYQSGVISTVATHAWEATRSSHGKPTTYIVIEAPITPKKLVCNGLCWFVMIFAVVCNGS